VCGKNIDSRRIANVENGCLQSDIRSKEGAGNDDGQILIHEILAGDSVVYPQWCEFIS
jgi:hypothetical protein